MIKVTITKSGVVTNEGQFPSQDEAQRWFDNLNQLGVFGDPSTFEVQYLDITAQVSQDAVNAEALSYLASTDWYAIRFADTGEAIPDDVKTLRAQARAKIVK